MKSLTLKNLFILFSIIVIYGCASAGKGKIDQLPQGHKVLIISILGDDLITQNIGTTLFGNFKDIKNVNDWLINISVENEIALYMNKKPNINVVTNYSSNYKKQIGRLSNNFFTSKVQLEGGINTIKSIAKNNHVDSIFIIASNRRQDPIYGSNQYLEGYGIYQYSGWWQKRSNIYASISIGWFDGKTGKEIARSASYSYNTEFSTTWYTKDNVQTEGVMPNLKDEIITQIKQAVVNCLNTLNY